MNTIIIRKVWLADNVIFAEILIDIGGLQLYATVCISVDNEIRIESIDSKPPLDDCLACLAYLNASSSFTASKIRREAHNL
mgnify:CR=1 FL=1